MGGPAALSARVGGLYVCVGRGQKQEASVVFLMNSASRPGIDPTARFSFCTFMTGVINVQMVTSSCFFENLYAA